MLLNRYLPLNGLRVDEETAAKALLNQNECINATFLVLAWGQDFQELEEVDQLDGQLLFSQLIVFTTRGKWLLLCRVLDLSQRLVTFWSVSNDKRLCTPK